MDTLESVIGDYHAFLATIIGKVEAAGFDLNDCVQLDHMCYRTTSPENYQQKKQELEQVGTLMRETVVNGRPIAGFRLHKPVIHDRWRIDAVEIPAPREGHAKKEGLEHVEFVIYDDKQTFVDKYKDKQFKLDSFDRGINPEIVYQLDESMAVKFHLLSLSTVMYLENKLGIDEVKN